MGEKQELQVRDKQELAQKGEITREGPHFTPLVDIYELENSLVLVADMPGASNKAIDVGLQDDLLTFTARVPTVESRWKPLYTEYEIGSYMRQFKLGQLVDRDKISAQMKDGVLTLTIPKVAEALPRRISVRTEE